MNSQVQPAVPAFRLFACETRLVTGRGAIKLIPDELKTYQIKRPALIVDSGIANAGLIEKWVQPEVASLQPRILTPVNPDLNAVQEGIDEAKKFDCDGVIIIGGGSAICMGKAISICLVNEGTILDYEGNEKLQRLPVPTICVPTTAGSGSEVSRALVLHEKGRRQEIIVRARGSEPRVALLDGDLLVSAPRRPLLDAALDAITHACESLWSRGRNMVTDALAEGALQTFLTRLPAAINDRDPEALQAILEASSAANLACGNAGLALVHSLNTAPDVTLPHGYTNGCLLRAVAAFNRPLLEERHQKLVDQLPRLFEQIGWQGRFENGEVGPKISDLFVDASRGHPFRKNNIREISDAECYELLRQSGATVAVEA